MFLEIYEELFWLAENSNRGVLPTSGKTLGGWASDLHRRRTESIYPNFSRAGNPFPTTYSFTFNRSTQGTAPQTYYFVHGSKCGQGKQGWGTIINQQPP